MNRSIRLVAASIYLFFGLLVVMLTFIQVIKGPEYRDDERNPRLLAARADRERGPIVARDGRLIAESIEVSSQTAAFERRYPFGSLFSHPVGYATFLFAERGLESERSSDLSSSRNLTFSGMIDEILGRDTDGQGLRLTLSPELQDAARAGLGDQPGAVVAIEPSTGEVLAMYSSPTYDPNRLVAGDTEYGDAINREPGKPLLDRTRAELYPPGSAFKVITTAAALESGTANARTLFEDVTELVLPGSTSTISNFNGGFCNGGEPVTLEVAFARSCNTVFGQLGLDVDEDDLIDMAQAFGFNQDLGLDMELIESQIPTDFSGNRAGLAQTAIGERDVRATPVQMAVVAATVANGGISMQPYLVAETFERDLTVIQATQSAIRERAIGPGTAAALKDLMIKTVTQGTGRSAAIEGAEVGGKTGTAQGPGGNPDLWFIGFATRGERSVAVAVVVEDGGLIGADATGGAVAAPIARDVMAAWLAGS